MPKGNQSTAARMPWERRVMSRNINSMMIKAHQENRNEFEAHVIQIGDKSFLGGPEVAET